MSVSERYRKTHQLSWQELQKSCRELARRLSGREWSRIIAVARGGLIPAAILARELDVRLVDTVCISSYSVREQGSLNVLKNADAADCRTLVVDDLSDTGGTAACVRQMFPDAVFVTVCVKPAGRQYVDEFVTEVSQDTWVLFPWDAGSVYVPPLCSEEISGK